MIYSNKNIHFNKFSCTLRSKRGFVLVLSMAILVVLSLLGIWALNRSNTEIQISASMQRYEENFNITEGATNIEASRLGFNERTFYLITDPTKLNQLLIPVTETDFDPGNDTTTLPAGITATSSVTWPWANLLNDNNDSNDIFDYGYLATYLESGPPPLGYDAGSFSGYKFRVQGASRQTPLVVEVGGIKVGVKASM